MHLRFDVRRSSLPDIYKERLLALPDRRLIKEGVLVIKAQKYRKQEQNRELALHRLQDFIRQAILVRKRRIAIKPSRAARVRRMNDKKRRGNVKALRGKVTDV